MKPSDIKLIYHTPVMALVLEWKQSRSEERIPRIQDFIPTEADRKILEQCIQSRLPLLEKLQLTFLIENMPIVLREQLVRHRVGHKFGDQLGVDIIPDLADSSFWSQTMRIRDMSDFASTGKYDIPEVIDQADSEIQDVYQNAMLCAEIHYRNLLLKGVPADEARMVIPLAATHRMTWTTNYMALCHLSQKRTCWLAQLGIWKPFLAGILTELRTLDPLLGQALAHPPCIKDDHFCECVYRVENCGRMRREDPGVPCRLWMAQHENEAALVVETCENPAFRFNDLTGWESGDIPLTVLTEKTRQYEQLWQCNPLTGRSLQ